MISFRVYTLFALTIAIVFTFVWSGLWSGLWIPPGVDRKKELKHLESLNKMLPLSKTPVLSIEPEWRSDIRLHYETFLEEYKQFVARVGNVPLHKENVDGFASCDKLNKWNSIVLRLFDEDTKFAHMFPNTMKVLNDTGRVSSIIFSTLAPGAKLEPHRGVSRSVLRYHLALRVPRDFENCHITLWDEHGREFKHIWREREDVVFDDNFLHEVKNETTESRTVLFLDIKREFDNPVHSELSRDIMKKARNRVKRCEIEKINTNVD